MCCVQRIKASGNRYEVLVVRFSVTLQELRKRKVNSEKKSVPQTHRVHPFPFRTRKLSCAVLKILCWRRHGKIGQCRHRRKGNRSLHNPKTFRFDEILRKLRVLCCSIFSGRWKIRRLKSQCYKRRGSTRSHSEHGS